MALNRRQVVFGISVLVLGLCCALPFQKSRTEPVVSSGQNVSEARDEFTWLPDGVTLQVPAQDQSSPATSLDDPASRRHASQQLIPPPRVRKHANLEQTIPAEVVPKNPKALLRPDETLPFDSSIPDPKQALLPGKILPDWEWYLVRSGDTMAGLAERFWGDAQQSGRIQELNQEEFTELQVLPVGRKIRIPKSPLP
jgi:nucleoid-associated protein YgaU